MFVTDTPPGLKARGAALWASLDAERDLAGGGATLAEEACRIADRLDKLDAILTADAKQWGHFRRSLDNMETDNAAPKYVLVITAALSEARQQALVMRQIVAGLPVKGGDDDNGAAETFLAGLSG